MEITLLHHSVDEHDRLTRQGLREPVDHCTTHLILRPHGIDNLAAHVRGDPHLVYRDIRTRDARLDDLGKVAPM